MYIFWNNQLNFLFAYKCKNKQWCYNREAVESVKTLEQTQSLKKGEAKKMVAVANAKIVVLKQQLDANEKHTKVRYLITKYSMYIK